MVGQNKNMKLCHPYGKAHCPCAATATPARLAGNTLLWERQSLTLRLEAAIDRDTALRIATSAH